MTLQKEYDKVLNNLTTSLDISDPDQSIVAFCQAQAGLLYLLRKYQQDLQQNFTPENAYSESEGGTLEQFGRYVLGRDPNPATQGIYTLDITGSAGGTVVTGTQLRYNNEYLFEVQADVTLTGSMGQISVIALTAGTEAVMGVSDELFFTIPIADVDSLALVSVIDTEPVDEETEEEYRAQIELIDKLEAQGGSPADYRIWGADATGVVNIFPYATSEPGIADVYVEANTSDGVPTQTILDYVSDVIDFNPDTTLENRGRRPIGAFNVNVYAVTPINVDIEITNLTNTDDIPVIEDAIVDYLTTVRPQVDGADDPNTRKDILSLANINTVINNSMSQGTQYDNVTLEVNSVEVSTYQFSLGNIPILNSLTAV